jgi:hypothetical protein
MLFQSCKPKEKYQSIESLNRVISEISSDPGINAGDLNYAFDLPPGWSRLDTVIHGIRITYLLQKDTDNFRPVINVTSADMHGKGLQEYVTSTKEYLSNTMDVELLDDGEIPVLGGKGLWYSYTRTFNGMKREMIFYSIPINGVSYNITAGVNSDGMPGYRQRFDQIVKSFKIVKESFNNVDSSFINWLDSTK